VALFSGGAFPLSVVQPLSSNDDSIDILGIDLAWGERNGDGLAWLHVDEGGAYLQETALCHGDAALLEWLSQRAARTATFLAMDAPVICPNASGARPVDVLTHQLFRRWKCGCHPTNQRLCPRPLRLVRELQRLGYTPGWQGAQRLLCEVYPHPATVRWFGLSERLLYKKGRVAERRVHFTTLQQHLVKFMNAELPELRVAQSVQLLLQQSWTKDVEDQTDAVLAALIGYWHWRHQGSRSQVLGDLDGGFILLPA
jgi:predicted RNase H-like nuclease